MAVLQMPVSEPGLFDADAGDSITDERKRELVGLFDRLVTKPERLRDLEGWREPAGRPERQDG